MTATSLIPSRMRNVALATGALVACILCVSCANAPDPGGSGVIPAYDHVVVAIEENHSYGEVAGEPYISSLIGNGTVLTNYHGIGHPSEPNYVALFSGSTHGITDDGRYDLTGPNLYTRISGAGKTFGSYSEGLPSVGYRGAKSGDYVRKHAPWASFADVPDAAIQPFSAFPSDYSTLPSLSFVVPNLQDDMHDGSVSAGDAWLKNNLSGYIDWAKTHNSLFVLTFDEGSGGGNPSILTVLVGAKIAARKTVSDNADHYTLLRTLDAIFNLSPIGTDATRKPLDSVWQ